MKQTPITKKQLTAWSKAFTASGERKLASMALSRTAERLSGLLSASGNAYIRERSEDIRGLAASLSLLLAEDSLSFPSVPCILVAEELSPAQLLSLDRPDLIRGILTEKIYFALTGRNKKAEEA